MNKEEFKNKILSKVDVKRWAERVEFDWKDISYMQALIRMYPQYLLKMCVDSPANNSERPLFRALQSYGYKMVTYKRVPLDVEVWNAYASGVRCYNLVNTSDNTFVLPGVYRNVSLIGNSDDFIISCNAFNMDGDYYPQLFRCNHGTITFVKDYDKSAYITDLLALNKDGVGYTLSDFGYYYVQRYGNDNFDEICDFDGNNVIEECFQGEMSLTNLPNDKYMIIYKKRESFRDRQTPYRFNPETGDVLDYKGEKVMYELMR